MSDNRLSIFPVTAHTSHVGTGTTFVAIKGAQTDGVIYILEAIEKGATAIVVAADAVVPDATVQVLEQRKIPLIRVADTRRALASLSAQAHEYPARQLQILGVTGTKGKTTSVFLLEHMLRTLKYKTALLSTVQNRILDESFSTALTTCQPDYIHAFLRLCVAAGVTHVVMEVSAQALSLQRVHGILFAGIVFTNFDQEHAEFYPSIDEYFSAKKMLFTQIYPGAPVMVNTDDSWGKRLAHEYQVQSFLPFVIDRADRDGVHFTIQPTAFYCPSLIGQYNVYNLVGVISLLHAVGISLDALVEPVRSFGHVPGRMERYAMSNGAVCIIDYAHTPASFTALLTTLRHFTRQLIVVFGCGGDRDPIKRPLMGKIASELADVVILTMDNPRSEDVHDITQQILFGVVPGATVICELDREQAIRKAYSLSASGAIIALLGKGPDEYQIIKGIKIPFSERAVVKSL